VSHAVTQAGDQAPFDLDEDLFDFAGVAREADAIEPDEDIEELFASLRAGPPAEELLDVPAVSAAPAAAPAPIPAPVRAVHEPAIEPARAPEPLRPPAPSRPGPAPRVSERVHELAPAPRSSPLSKSVLLIVLSVTALNSVLAVVALHGPSGAGEVRPAEPLEVVEHDEDGALAAPPHAVKAALPDPESVDPAHSHPALDEARAEISRGEYAAARQRVYGLLAIIDRLDDPRRGALEADCQYLIAQSLHLEALARMGGTL
jgi:hypothetical protein